MELAYPRSRSKASGEGGATPLGANHTGGCVAVRVGGMWCTVGATRRQMNRVGRIALDGPVLAAYIEDGRAEPSRDLVTEHHGLDEAAMGGTNGGCDSRASREGGSCESF